MSSSGNAYEDDGGKALSNFNTSDINLSTVAPAFGVTRKEKQPDYLDYDQNRGIMVTMFANAGGEILHTFSFQCISHKFKMQHHIYWELVQVDYMDYAKV